MEDIQLLPMVDPETGSLSDNIEQSVQNRIFVNKEGERFVDEGERRDVMTQALMEQKDSLMWAIVNSHSYPSGDVTNNFNETIDELVEAGRVNKVSPHIFRHSKAMHLLEGGVNLIYIRDFLGHSSITTTEIYAKSNPEVKRKAIEQASHNVIPEEKFTKNEKDNLLNWLKEFI